MSAGRTEAPGACPRVTYAMCTRHQKTSPRRLTSAPPQPLLMWILPVSRAINATASDTGEWVRSQQSCPRARFDLWARDARYRKAYVPLFRFRCNQMFGIPWVALVYTVKSLLGAELSGTRCFRSVCRSEVCGRTTRSSPIT